MKKSVLILNGPNLNLLGRRDPRHYGSMTMDAILEELRSRFTEVEIEYFQSNYEGAIIDCLHGRGFDGNLLGIVLNAGAYTHTSLAIADAIDAVSAPVVEVHLSNVGAREEIRRRSMIAPVCIGSISGFGAESYALGVQALIDRNHES